MGRDSFPQFLTTFLVISFLTTFLVTIVSKAC